MKYPAMMLAFAVLSAILLASEPTTQPATAPTTAAATTQPAIAAVAERMGEGFAPLVETLGHGQIDWTAGTVIATGTATGRGSGGQARASAIGAARLVAARNAILLLAELRTGAPGRIRALRSGRISVDAVLKDFTELDRSYDEQTRQATVRLQASLLGARGVVSLTGVAASESARAWDWPDNVDVDEDTAVNGIVIDARGVELAPALLPIILTIDGRRVFGPVDRRDRQTMVTYVSARVLQESKPGERNKQASLAAAARRVFSRPLILRHAAGAKRRSLSTLILSAPAEQDLAQHPEARRLFLTGRVIVIAYAKVGAEN
ncbi:hypothetical protein LCGC14_0204000 [marine sediment metagenome]|uniref:Uncharacterized protein n=1 Tax=marine sediment metagenome TaxID=412755 RepID=A0A0F9UZG1_9ZZZZ|nr:hypothetical protein [Phycisphaerae bacterium]HDZ43457.1 hypothetical protein [Phycisphaerae bacterium]